MRLRFLAFALCLSGCVVGDDYVKPNLELPSHWQGQGFDAGDVTDLSAWWQMLGDPVLTELIEQASVANLDLRTADAQLRQARAQRSATGSSQFPTLSASSGQSSAGSIEGGGTNELYTANFDAGWELDLFGERARTLEAADADLASQVEAQRDVMASVFAEVALNYVELRMYQAQLASAERNLEIQVRSQEVVQAKVDSGAGSNLELQQAKANTATTRSELPRIRQSLEFAKNRLNVLLGEAPGTLSRLDEAGDIPKANQQISVGIPADLLRRRPDVRLAERRLAAETARVGAAQAARYPNVTLGGTIGVESLNFQDLFGGSAASFGFSLLQDLVLFDAGRLRAQVEVQSAVQEQALLGYERAVLVAMEEVENSLVALVQEQLRYNALEEAVASNREGQSIAALRYEAGAINLLSLLDTQRNLLSSEDRLLASQSALTTNLIRLYKALGGGWSLAQ